MKLYYTNYLDLDSSIVLRIGITPPEKIDTEFETVYEYDWDEKSDIPTEALGRKYEGIFYESNYKEDAVFHNYLNNKIYLYIGDNKIEMPDDYKRLKVYYSKGQIVKTEEY